MKKLLYLGVLGLAISSCAKDNSTSIDQNVNSFGEMTINGNFDWQTSHDVLLNVDGLEDGSDVQHFLIVSDPDGNELSKTLTTIAESNKLYFSLADQHDFVMVKFGSIEKRVDISNRKGEFDFLAFDDRSDLDPIDR